ncbi:MAG: VacJ family lipoprotein [Alphaproteobacteria bacterium]|nr:VacJ family lipoprotein [Alphaproteobacteria bacterium]
MTCRLCFLAALIALAGCAAPQPPAEVADPFEAQNRQVHAFNLGLDRAIRPRDGAAAADPAPPSAGTIMLSRAGANLGLPAAALNGALQGRPDAAVVNVARFAVNSTVGLLGLFDPAGAIGISARPADFGQTLHMWGVGEGDFLMLPVLGPSTTRDMAGRVVDALIDPLGQVVKPPESYGLTAVRIGGRIADRARLGGTIDSILDESADSYAQLRLAYVQNRRFQLGLTGAADDFEDPYAAD